VYEADEESRIHLSYYKNTVINPLAPAAIISNIILKLSGIPKKSLEDEYGRIRTLFSKEFSIEDDAFEKALDYLIERKMLKKSWGNISYEKEASDMLAAFSGLITDYLESYLVVMKNMTKVTGAKDVARAFESKAELMLKKAEIERPEALCVPNFKGAIEYLKSSNIIDRNGKVTSEKELGRLAEEIQGYLEK
jgi:glycerol-3-phosphate O-acyltransferase